MKMLTVAFLLLFNYLGTLPKLFAIVCPQDGNEFDRSQKYGIFSEELPNILVLLYPGGK